GMVQDVESLSANLKFRGLPLGDAEVLHQGQVGIEEVRAINLIATLVAECCHATGDHGRSEFRRSHASGGGLETIEHIRGTAVEWSNVGVSKEGIAVTVAGQGSAGSAIGDSEGQSGAEEERA